MSQQSQSVQQDAPAVPATGAEIGPEICPQCYSDLVQPMDACAQQDGSVLLTLRCPECHHRTTAAYSWEAARKFGRTFAAAKAQLRATHADLAKENFRDELDCFVLALASDLIGPDDFAPYRYAA
ncbi:MAG: hypothetical protein HZB14_08645 [Actinobacteria bacterium]|nr:hypothetical protein [Actinomycetota bacterium]